MDLGFNFYEYKDGKFTSKYEGNWYFDKKKGKGKANYSDESYYDGEFDNDLYDGNGKLFWKQGMFILVNGHKEEWMVKVNLDIMMDMF